MSTKRSTQKESISGLKSRERVFVFNGEDPYMEQIDDHRVSLSHRVARGLVHGLISYGQSHEMVIHDFGYMALDQARSALRLPKLQKIGGLSSTALKKP